MRELVPGSRLDQIAQSDRRYPRFKVWFHNPRCSSMTQVATGTYTAVPFDASPFVESVSYEENIGYENSENPSTTRIQLRLRRHPRTGVNIRRGLIEDGVIVQVFTGDGLVSPDEWILIFTGVFRGRPGDDPGTPADKSEGLTATAHGREEGFLNLMVTTDAFPVDVDMGVMANAIAQDPLMMGLSMDEVLFGVQGFESKHVTNQIVDTNCLTALYQLGFTVGKKPKFDSYGRLRFVDVNLDKPAARIYADRALFKSIKATPNEIEVNNSVVMKGLAAILTKAKGENQLIDTFEAITGFFDSSFKEDKYYSQDHSQRAENTSLHTKHKIWFSDADWDEVDEFHGRVDIDCRTLYDARLIIFVTYLALEIAVTALDLAMDSGGQEVSDMVIITSTGPTTVAVWRAILHTLSLVALAGLLWSMQFIGRGSYEIWGQPFEFVYQELMVRAKKTGIDLPQLREIEYRNDFISDVDTLEELALAHLRREMLKNQTYEVVMLYDPLIEVDDIIEIAGERHYVSSVECTFAMKSEPIMTLKTWLIYRNVLAEAIGTAAENDDAGLVEAQVGPLGYGFGYGEFYGDQL